MLVSFLPVNMEGHSAQMLHMITQLLVLYGEKVGKSTIHSTNAILLDGARSVNVA